MFVNLRITFLRRGKNWKEKWRCVTHGKGLPRDSARENLEEAMSSSLPCPISLLPLWGTLPTKQVRDTGSPNTHMILETPFRLLFTVYSNIKKH